MSKHAAPSDNGSAHNKRQRPSEPAVAKKALEEIHSARQLQQVLAFQQDAGPYLRQGILSFKSLLGVVVYGEDIGDKKRKQEILLTYLQSQKPLEDDHTSNYLPDLIQTWSFAAQSNNDSLLSAVPAVLALLLKSISSLIDFRDYGTLLCKTLLRRDQLKLFDRGFTANKTKEHLISPCLRLLTEIVLFDGGSSARSLYVQRDITFKRLDTFLSLRKLSSEDSAKDARRPSVRSNAVWYLLANLKLQDKTAKAGILSQGKLFRSLFQDIKEDPPNIISEVLGVLKKHVVLDDTLPRAAKSRVLTDYTLGRIATLYGFDRKEDEYESIKTTVRDLAHGFLLFVCTALDHGVLTAQTGWYPPGATSVRTDLYAKDVGDDHIDLDGLTQSVKYQGRVSVRNTTLAAFLQNLRPYADTQQRELVLAIFDAAPELIADYFFKKKSFSFEPKLTATWIGFSAFLFSTVQLPVPLYFGLKSAYGDVPPPVPIAIESILPQPLSQKVLTSCLNQNVELITFFAVRLLTSAFLKLEVVLESLYAASVPNKNQWEQSALRLIAEFCRRCPEMKHVVTVFRSCPAENTMLREAATRLLLMYYKVIPQIALLEKFDISIALSVALSKIGEVPQDSESKGVRLLELDNLLEIAYRSPHMRWWHKPDDMPLSPFTTILRLKVESQNTRPSDRIRGLLQSIVQDNAILQQHTKKASLDALLDSLMDCGDWHASDTLFQFLDNCILRYVRKPVKYYDDLAKMNGETASTLDQPLDQPISLLLVAVMEQWPFLVKSAEPSQLTNVTEWLARYLDCSRFIGEDLTKLSDIKNKIRLQVKDKECRGILKKALKRARVPNFSSSQEAMYPEGRDHAKETMPSGLPNRLPNQDTLVITPQTPSGPPGEDENHPELTRWIQKDVSDAVEDGTVGQLVLCLCSTYGEIRKQALGSLCSLLAKVQASDYNERQQIYVLVGEIVDTARDSISDGPLPYFVGVIAARSLLVLADPLHFMYIKVNKFLNKGPPWNVSKLPSYWIDKIMLHPPSDDDAHDHEVGWLLDALLDGLRTPSDMNLYRRCHVFERLLSLYASPSLPAAHMEKILHLLFRCTYVDGSGTLITRAGIISWITCQAAQMRPDDGMVRQLAQRVYQTCSQERVNDWSNGTLAMAVDRLKSPSAR